MTEQGHASVSTIMKQHNEYNSGSVHARAVILQAQPLFQVDPELAKVEQLRGRINRLKKKQRQRVMGRHMFLKALREQASSSEALGKTWLCSDVGRFVIKQHGKLWHKLDKAKQSRFEQQAMLFWGDRQDTINEKMQALRSESAAQRAKVRENVDQGCSMSSCRLSDAQRCDLDDMYKLGQCAGKHIDALRAQVAMPVRQPSQEFHDVMESIDIPVGKKAVARPDWLRWACEHLDFMVDSAVRFERSGRTEYYNFVFAMQNPMLVCMCRLRPLEQTFVPVDPGEYHSRSLAMWDHILTPEYTSLLFTDDGGFDGAEDIHMFSGVLFIEDKCVVADGAWVPMAWWQQHIGGKRMAANSEVHEAEPEQHIKKVPDAWLQHPSSRDFVRSGGRDASKETAKHAPAPLLNDEEAADCMEVEDELAALEELWSKRMEIGVDTPTPFDGFGITRRGGAWTAWNKAVAYDCSLASAKRAQTKQRCQKYKLAASGSFSVARFGMDLANSLAQDWMHRHSTWYQSWVDRASGDSYMFTAEDLASVRDSEVAATIVASGNRAAIDRLAALRRLKPS